MTHPGPASMTDKVNSRVYLDGHATTPLAPEVKHAMLAAWSEPGNPGSPHFAGARAMGIVDEARKWVAELIGCAQTEVIFTAGATEANNLAILGCARAAVHNGSQRRHVLVGSIEHKSVLLAADALRAEGFEVEELPVDPMGLVSSSVLASALRDDTLLVSVGGANGEIGVVQRLDEIVSVARKAGALVHSDLAQLAGKVPVSVSELDLDYASVSAHKMYGPVGIGALYMSALAPALAPIVYGGRQERAVRPGTVAAPLAAGFGEAARIAKLRMTDDAQHARGLAELFLDELSQRQVRWKLNCDKASRIPGSLSLLIHGIDADSIISRVSHRLAISTGSACQSGELHPSHVLTALNLDEKEKRSTFRLFFGRFNHREDARLAAELIAAAVHQERLATGGSVQ